MTCPAFRTLLTVADHALNLLAFLLHPVAGWNAAADEMWDRATRPRDGAEQLAEAEAETEVTEPTINSELKVGAVLPCLNLNNPGCDGSYEKCHGFCWTWERAGEVDDDPTAFVDHDYVRPKLPGSKAETEGKCSTSGPYAWAICSKPDGHDGWHGYAGIFWSAYFSPATGHGLPPIPDYPAPNRSNPDSSCATGEAQCCGPAAQESPAAGPPGVADPQPAAGQPNHPPK